MKNLLRMGLQAASLVGALGLSQGVFAQPVDGIRHGGPGCPTGTLSAVRSPDGQVISVIFDRFSIESGGASAFTGGRRLRCSMMIPITVPPGTQLAVYQVDYRGYANLPEGGYAMLSGEYSLGNRSVQILQRKVKGPVDGNFQYTHTLGSGESGWGTCGGTTLLRVDATLFATTNDRNEPALASVDSTDGAPHQRGGLVYRLQKRRCKP